MPPPTTTLIGERATGVGQRSSREIPGENLGFLLLGSVVGAAIVVVTVFGFGATRRWGVTTYERT